MDYTESTTKAPRITTELFSIPVAPGRYLVYAPLRRAAFVANATMVNSIARLKDTQAIGHEQPDIVELLERLGIVNGPEDTLPITTFSGDPLPTAVTLFLTTACNLRCTYCYAAAGDTPVKNMALGVAKRGIDFVIANAVKAGADHVEINYHGGGEPTVNWAVLTASFHYAKDAALAHGLELHGSCATNGMLSDPQIDWLITHLSGASVSFDGLPEVQDRNRVTVGGKGSSARVERTLSRFDAAGFAYGLRLTVTHDLIEHLPGSIDHICARFRPFAIQVEPAFQMGRWKDAPSAETQGFIDAYRDAQLVANRYGQKISFSGARLGLLTNHFCGISQDSFCLTPDGSVSGCFEAFSETTEWARKFIYGKMGQGVDRPEFDLRVLGHLRDQAVHLRKYCEGCFAKWSCGGDCYHQALTVNGDTEFEGTDRCHIIRELTKDQLLEKIAASGTQFWNEGPE